MEANIAKLIIITVILMIIAASLGELVIKPNNIVVIVGAEVVFQCQSNYENESIFWSFLKSGGGYLDSYNIYRNKRLLRGRENRFNITVSPTGLHTFILKNASLLDAGSHIFTDNNGYGRTYVVEVVVLESIPSCQTETILEELTNQETMEISCEVHYTGVLELVTFWRDSAGRVLEPTKDLSNNSDKDVAVTTVGSSLKLLFVDIITLCIVMYFERPTKQDTSNAIFARNVPEYHFDWTTSKKEFEQVCQKYLPSQEIRMKPASVTPASRFDNKQRGKDFATTVPLPDSNNERLETHHGDVTYVKLEQTSGGFQEKQLIIILSLAGSGALVFVVCFCVARKLCKRNQTKDLEKSQVVSDELLGDYSVPPGITYSESPYTEPEYNNHDERYYENSRGITYVNGNFSDMSSQPVYSQVNRTRTAE